MTRAGNHSALLHHLKTVSGMGVVAAKAGGRALHPVYLLEPTRPADSKRSWDVANRQGVAVTPMDQAWRPLSEGHCSR